MPENLFSFIVFSRGQSLHSLVTKKPGGLFLKVMSCFSAFIQVPNDTENADIILMIAIKHFVLISMLHVWSLSRSADISCMFPVA